MGCEKDCEFLGALFRNQFTIHSSGALIGRIWLYSSGISGMNVNWKETAAQRVGR